MKIKHLSKQSFSDLLHHIAYKVPLTKVFFSQLQPEQKPPEKILIYPFVRVDVPLSGVKRMRFPAAGKVHDELMQPGQAHYCPPLCWKEPCWDYLHSLTSLVYMPKYIRITYINHDNSENNRYEREAANIFYHTANPISSTGMMILHTLNNYAGLDSASTAGIDLLKALFKLTAEEIANDSQRIFSKAHVTWMHAAQYVQEHFTEAINLGDVAMELGVSREYLSRLFVREGGENFNVALRRLRMEHAALLLKNTSMPVSEVCDECGYLSTTFFISAFKNYFGMPPGKYRCHYQSN